MQRVALGSGWIAVGLVAALLVGLALRSVSYRVTFPEPGEVVIYTDDSSYHARRALHTFVNFPEPLLFDSHIAHPGGAPVPMPPLWNWLQGAIPRLFGDSRLTFQRLTAWSAPVASVLTVFPVFALACLFAGPRVGLVAAWTFSVLPASNLLATVGNLDHHAFVTLLAACWLLSSIVQTRPPAGRAATALRIGLHATVVAAMLLTWSGSLLYLGIAEGVRLATAGVLWMHRGRLVAQAAACLAAAALVAPWVAASPDPIGGAWTSTTLSRLHVAMLAALAGLGLALALFDRLRPARGVPGRVVRALACALLFGAPLLALPGVREALQVGATFVAGADSWAPTNPEQQPLFYPGGMARSPTIRFGWLVYAIPLFPLLVALRLLRPTDREPYTILLFWITPFTALAISQLRFSNDLSPLVSLVFALALAELHARLARRFTGAAPVALSAGLAVLLLWPALVDFHLFRVRYALRSDPKQADELFSPRALMRFGRQIRDATPPTSGFLESGAVPEYGLLVPATLGHGFVYAAERPVPACNFGPYLDEEKYLATMHFYGETRDSAAGDILEELDTRFVLTMAGLPGSDQTFAKRVHQGDGILSSRCRVCLRLMTEGPLPERPDGEAPAATDAPSEVAYKLFEYVPGARLEVLTRPGAWARLALELETPTERRVSLRLSGQAGPDGVVRMTLPYATEPIHPVRALGPYRVETAEGALGFEVPDAAVLSGERIAVELRAGAD